MTSHLESNECETFEPQSKGIISIFTMIIEHFVSEIEPGNEDVINMLIFDAQDLEITKHEVVEADRAANLAEEDPQEADAAAEHEQITQENKVKQLTKSIANLKEEMTEKDDHESSATRSLPWTSRPAT